jgi:hypothetical protein
MQDDEDGAATQTHEKGRVHGVWRHGFADAHQWGLHPEAPLHKISQNKATKQHVLAGEEIGGTQNCVELSKYWYCVVVKSMPGKRESCT